MRIEFGTAIDPNTSDAVLAFCEAMRQQPIDGLVDCAPAYTTAIVHYDPRRIGYEAACREIDLRLERSHSLPPISGRTVEIPVRYGGAEGPDLEFVAHAHDLTPEDVVRLHSSADYRVYMLGFLPGFPFLGGLPDALVTPRRPTPRIRVPAGSVAIGGAQTGVYPVESPGGWRLIGRTEVVLYDPERPQRAALSPGDRVKFVPRSD